MAKQNTTIDKKEEDIITTDIIKATDTVEDPKSVMLKIHLDLVDSSGSVANVHQDIMLPCLKEPAFIKGAYEQVEKTLDIVGVDFFKKLVRNYFMNCINETFNSGFNTSDHSNVTTAGYLPLDPSMDQKIVVDTRDVADGSSDQTKNENPNINLIDNNGTIDLDVELD